MADDKDKEDKPKPVKLPAWLGGYDPASPASLGYFPAFPPGMQAALANQMAQAYGGATMQPSFGGPINAANGLPMAGAPASPGHPAISPQTLTGPTQADYMKHLDQVYTPMGSAVPKPTSPVTVTPPVVPPVVKPVVKPANKNKGGKSGGMHVSGTVATPALKRKLAADAQRARESGSYSSNLNHWRIKNGRTRYYNPDW